MVFGGVSKMSYLCITDDLLIVYYEKPLIYSLRLLVILVAASLDGSRYGSNS